MEIVLVLLSRLTIERGLALLSFSSILIHILLAPIVYFKIVRKLDRIDPALKYSVVAIMPPLIQQAFRGSKYAIYIIKDQRNYRDVLQRGKVVGELHFRKYCSRFDLVLSYVYITSIVVFGISITLGLFFYAL